MSNTKLTSKEFPKVTNPSFEDVFDYTAFKILTRILNSLSLTFPIGEKFFCTAIRDHKDFFDERLKEEVKVFIFQEARHSMAHKSLNEHFGLNLSETDATSLYRLQKLGTTPHQRLMTTKALETLTAFGGKLYVYGGKYFFKKNQTSKIWGLHAKEEVQHEFVAEEVYKLVYGKNTTEYYLHFFKVVLELLGEVKTNYLKLKQIEKESKL